MADKFCVVVKALVLKKDKILLIKRGKSEDFRRDEWDFPGGKIALGEKPIEGLKREVVEETGLRVDVVKPIDVWTFFRNNEQVVGITFVATPISEDIHMGEEHTEYRWISPKEIDDYLVNDGIKKSIRKMDN